MAKLTQRNKMCVGDAVEYLTPGKVGTPFVVGELLAEDGSTIESTKHPYMTFYMKTPFVLRAGDIIRAGDEK